MDMVADAQAAGPEVADRLSFGRLALFAAPALPAAAISFPIGAYLPPYYATQAGLSLTMVGLVFMVARFWDIVTDPVMGALTDRTTSRFGRRRPWLAASAPVILLGAGLLFFPPVGVGIAWTLVALFLAYTGYTMLTITQFSWAADLAGEYHERSRLQGAVLIASIVGLLSAMLLPALVEGNAVDPAAARVHALGWYVLVLTLPAVAAALLTTPDPPRSAEATGRAWSAARRLIARPEYARLLLADFVQGIAGGLLLSGFVFTVGTYLALGDRAALLLLVFFASGIVFVPLWLRVGRRLSKHRTICLSSAVTIPFIAGLFLAPAGSLWVAGALMAGFGSTMGVWIFLTRSIVADLDELEFRRSGQRQTGTAFALVTLSTKLGGAVAVGAGFAALGFDPARAGEASADTARALAAITFGAPILGHLAVIALLWWHPDDRARLSASAGL